MERRITTRIRIAATLAALALASARAGAQSSGPPTIAQSAAEVTALEARADAPPYDLVTALLKLGVAYGNAGDTARQATSWQRALALARARLEPLHPRTYELTMNLAQLAAQQGRYDEALAAVQALVSLRESVPNTDRVTLADMYFNMASFSGLAGLADDARRWRSRGIATMGSQIATMPDTYLPHVAQTLCGQAIAAPAEAEAQLAPLAARLTAVRGSGDTYTLEARGCLAVAQAWQGKNDAARAEITGVIQGIAKLPQSDRSFRISLLGYVSSVFSRIPRSDLEAEAVALALSDEIAQVLGTKNLRYVAAQIGVAQAQLGQGRFDEGAATYRRAIAGYADLLGPGSNAAITEQINLANFYTMHGDARTAFALAGDAYPRAVAATALVGDSDVAQRRASAALAVTAFNFTNFAWQASKADPATRAQTLRLAFAAAQRSYPSEAGQAVNERTAYQLAVRSGHGAEFRDWQASRAALAALDARISAALAAGPSGDAERIGLLAGRGGSDKRLADAAHTLRNAVPGLFAVVAPEPVEAGALQGPQGLLRDDEVLLVVGPGDRLGLPGHVFAVTREAIAWARVDSDPRALADEISALHAMLAEPLVSGTTKTRDATDPAKFLRYDRARAHGVYKALFGDRAIARIAQAKPKWIIVPQGLLTTLDFAALVESPPEGGAAGDIDPATLRATRWLGLERTLAILPSVAALAIARRAISRERGAKAARFFGMGDPAFRGVADAPIATAPVAIVRAKSGQSKGARRAPGDAASLSQLGRLPETATEIRDLAAALGAGPGDYALQLDASEAALKLRSDSGALRGVTVFALATHGLMAGDLGGALAEPALALTPSAGAHANGAEDGLLTASEASTLALENARLVILSACDTGAGRGGEAEGLSGLARAFLLAGSRSLIVSYFPVDDRAGRALTSDAVRRLSGDAATTAAAMRAAMRDVFADTSNDETGSSFAHPAYWAPFAVIDPQ